MIRFSRLFAVAALAGLFAFSTQIAAFSQSSDPAWLEKLSRQLAVEQQCEVEYFVNMREGTLGINKTFEARAQCRDGRQFDGSRTEPTKTFTIRPCGNVVC